MDLAAVRYAIRPLLNERLPADAMAVYYAFHHDADKTFIVTSMAPAGWVDGFVTCSRTGIDLFRPFLTMRLPLEDLARSRTLLQSALPSGQEAFAAIPSAYLPLIRALCDVQTEEELAIYALPSERFKPLLNVLATREDESDGSPRFVVKQLLNGQRTAVTAAGVNWLSPHFSEIAVRTRPEYRQKGFGRGVVASLAEYLLAHGRTPLYAVNPANAPSIRLAESLGFVHTGTREWMLEIKMR